MAKSTFVKYSLVDAFTDIPFKGNPAAVCFLDDDQQPPDEWLQSVAAEFNLSQSCFLTPISTSPTRFHIRWFTPTTEVALCGHATLAAAHILFSSGRVDSDLIEFETLSGILTAQRVPEIKSSSASDVQNGEAVSFFIQLNFPMVLSEDYNGEQMELIYKALNGSAAIDMRMTAAGDLLVVFSSAEDVQRFHPNFEDIVKCPGKRGLLITAPAPTNSGFDIYSRFFCPRFGIQEDPVCGSAHCALAPYWIKKLGKDECVANAASPRGGVLNLRLDEKNQRVLLRGKAVTIMQGSILV